MTDKTTRAQKRQHQRKMVKAGYVHVAGWCMPDDVDAAKARVATGDPVRADRNGGFGVTDTRRATTLPEWLQGQPADIPLLIANAALCREHTPLALRQAAIALGVLDAIDVAWTPWNNGDRA
jgi:hypothetical protein